MAKKSDVQISNAINERERWTKKSIRRWKEISGIKREVVARSYQQVPAPKDVGIINAELRNQREGSAAANAKSLRKQLQPVCSSTCLQLLLVSLSLSVIFPHSVWPG